MFVIVQHLVMNKKDLPGHVSRMLEHPENLHLVQFVPAKDLMMAFSLWVAPSIDALREHVDYEMGAASVQEYHEVDEKHAVNLADVQVTGAGTAST